MKRGGRIYEFRGNMEGEIAICTIDLKVDGRPFIFSVPAIIGLQTEYLLVDGCFTSSNT